MNLSQPWKNVGFPHPILQSTLSVRNAIAAAAIERGATRTYADQEYPLSHIVEDLTNPSMMMWFPYHYFVALDALSDLHGYYDKYNTFNWTEKSIGERFLADRGHAMEMSDAEKLRRYFRAEYAEDCMYLANLLRYQLVPFDFIVTSKHWITAPSIEVPEKVEIWNQYQNHGIPYTPDPQSYHSGFLDGWACAYFRYAFNDNKYKITSYNGLELFDWNTVSMPYDYTHGKLLLYATEPSLFSYSGGVFNPLGTNLREGWNWYTDFSSTGLSGTLSYEDKPNQYTGSTSEGYIAYGYILKDCIESFQYYDSDID